MGPKPTADVLALGLVVAGLLVLGVLVHYVAGRGWLRGFTAELSYRRSLAVTGVGTLLLVGASLGPVQARSGVQAAGFIASLQVERLNERDAELTNRSYYSRLLETDLPMWQQQVSRQGVPQETLPLLADADIRATGDGRYVELLPRYEREGFRTNQWSMRDGAYALQKSPGTFRIAVLGGSIVLGDGVGQDDVFEALLEERLNGEHAGGEHARYEVLNFAGPKYALLQEAVLIEKKVIDFRPDVLMIVTQSDETTLTSDVMVRLIVNGTELPPFVADLVRREGVRPDMAPSEIRRRLLGGHFYPELYRWGYRRIAELSRENGIIPVWVVLPTLRPEQPEWARSMAHMRAWAQEAGFTLLDGSGVFAEHSWREIAIGGPGGLDQGDPRPNATGHRLIAEHLYELLREQDTALGLGLTAPRPDR